MSEEPRATQDETGYIEASATGFDHPNVGLMDNIFLITMNNEKLENGFIPSKEINKVKAEVGLMGASERMYAGGFYDVRTARAIEGGKFTLERGIEAARDGFTARMKRTEIGVQYMSPMQQRKGFLDKVFNRGKQEPQMYQGERQGR